MKNTPVDPEIIRKKIKESGLEKVGKGSIREIVKLVSEIEKATGVEYIRMEMGVPGLPCSNIGLKAEIEALQKGIPSIYPSMEGLPDLKVETARFLKLFADADFSPMGCIPSVGSMQGSMAAIMVATRCFQGKTKTLFIDPGFPVQKLQCSVLGQESYSFDIYNCRGLKLKEKLEQFLQNGDVGCILYSNPNNPTWVCLTEKELGIIAELADKYDVLVIEDLAYFGMDFRFDIQIPGKPPYQPTVRRFTDNCILLFSGSKVFNYAGQRIGMIAIPDSLFLKRFMYLKPFFGTDEFGHAIIYGALYALSAGTAHSVQYALAAMLKAANEGDFKFIDEIREYENRAQIMKQVFIENGFSLVYSKDEDKPLADGFYFTVSFPGLSGSELMEELLYYGISSVALDITGSTREGLRACVSQFKPNQKEILGERLKSFRANHS
jgi:aspartate/methionine/tyrosine aminotransferase